MNLHRTTGASDWQAVSVSERNLWQRIAARTHGIVTPGNIVTVIGLGLVIVGLGALLQAHYIMGTILVVVGRLFDLLDGWLAHATATKSPLGEIFDAAADKVGTILTVVTLFVGMFGPWWLLCLLVLPHVAIPIIAYSGRRRHKKIHPSRLGKLSMAAAWVGLIGLIIVHAAQLSWPALGAIMVYAICLLSSAMGLWSALGYAKEII